MRDARRRFALNTKAHPVPIAKSANGMSPAPPPVKGNEPEPAAAAATVVVVPRLPIDEVVVPKGSTDVVVEPRLSIDVVVEDEDVVTEAPSTVVDVVVVGSTVVVVVSGVRQSKGTHPVTPFPMFQVSARNPCWPATCAETSTSNSPGTSP